MMWIIDSGYTKSSVDTASRCRVFFDVSASSFKRGRCAISASVSGSTSSGVSYRAEGKKIVRDWVMGQKQLR